MATGRAYSCSVSKLINIPTDTKNTAPNKSFTGFIKCSICSALVVSAIIDPMIKAPNAGEKPAAVAKITIIKHSASDTINVVSSVRSPLVFFNKVGTKKIPAKNHKIKKKASLKIDSINSTPENCCETAMVDSKTINKMATISSTIKAPKTLPATSCFVTFSSSNARRMIVVDDMERMAPKKILSIKFQPSNFPVVKPTIIISTICTAAVILADPPTLTSFLKLNSSPKLNSKKITTISAHTSTFSIS